MLGDFTLNDMGVYERYFKHWLNPFSFSMGLFITLLMMFNASLFLLMEATTSIAQWKKLTVRIFILLIFSGMLTHGILFLTDSTRWKFFFFNPQSIVLIVLSFILLFPQVVSIRKRQRSISRVIAGAQLICIGAAGAVPLYPNFVLMKDGTALNMITNAAEAEVLKYLCFALIVGLPLILPGYFILMKIFKTKS